MGFINWIREQLKAEIKYTFEIKKTIIEMPKEGECVIFQMPRGTPRDVIHAFEDRIVEFQNSDRRFITTEFKISFVKNKKKAFGGVKSESNIDEGHRESKGTGQVQDGSVEFDNEKEDSGVSSKTG